MSNRKHVAVGVIYNSDKDKVLISKRTDKQHLAGFWEFPGGKVEKNEGVKVALARELFEELGIIVNKAERLMTISHDYSDEKVLLDVWQVNDWNGDANGRENQELMWALVDELNNYNFPDANKHIVSSISLPSTYLISQESYENTSCLFSVVKECFAAGLKLFQLRLKSRKGYNYSEIVSELKQLSNQYNAKLILNGSSIDIKQYDIDGIHFNSEELYKYSSRPIDNKLILGASCHNEKELIQASLLDVDYVFISPVLFTKSHPEAVAIGWDQFNTLSKKINTPVYALGGLSPKDLKKAKSFGAHGVAMISAVWADNNPGKIIRPY